MRITNNQQTEIKIIMKTKLKTLLLILTIFFGVSACKNDTKKNKESTKAKTFEKTDVTGNFVSDSYAKRSEGYDWVSVAVTKNNSNNDLSIKVRSRADRKKPTCTLDATVQKVNDSIYQTQIEGKTILFQFSADKLSIHTKNETDKSILNFYCSGGASLEGIYKRIAEPLDAEQIDKTQFSKVLNLQGIGFNISSVTKNGKNQFTVFTFGLPYNYNETFDINKEQIVNAKVEDLNSDGSPELVIFTQNQDEQKRMMVYGFSVNNRKSISQVYFQRTEENIKINNGYNGNDEFTLIETFLTQRFPIYENGSKTNKMRQIQYKLVDGEASRRFEVVKQREYNIK